MLCCVYGKSLFSLFKMKTEQKKKKTAYGSNSKIGKVLGVGRTLENTNMIAYFCTCNLGALLL